MSRYRNPLQRARNRGAAGSGVEHWWAQRFSAILLVPLTVWLVWSLSVLAGADFAAARGWIAMPWNSAMALLLIGAMFYHARLGVQVVIEDYVHHRSLEVTLQVLVAVAALAGAVIAGISVLQIALA